MKIIRDVISSCNVYTKDSPQINARLMEGVAHYITYILKVFGVISLDEGIGFPIEGEGSADLVSQYINDIMQYAISISLRLSLGVGGSSVCFSGCLV